MSKHVILFSAVFIFLIAFNQIAFGLPSEAYEEYLDFQPYTGNRELLFNDTSIDYCLINNEENLMFNHIAARAIKTWHDRIVDVTNNPYVWDMTMHIHPKNESICDGYVNFYDTPNPTSFQISGVAGFSHPLTPVANVTIYTDDYQSTLTEMAKNDKDFWTNMTLEKFQDIIKNGKHKQFDYDTINRITLHEIGHSLSLNHPLAPNGDLQSIKGIMGYNMSYNQIDDDEVLQIVKAYPNGFSKISAPPSIKLEDPNTTRVVHLGEVTNLTIELPFEEGKLAPSGIEVYIFPEGTNSQKTDFAPIKIVKTEGMNQLVNDEKYISDIHVSLVHWDTFTKVMSIQFKVINEFKNADIIVVGHTIGGFEKQWFLNDVLSVDKALFSDLLLNLDTNEYKYHLMGLNPNREIEKESAFETEQNRLYHEAFTSCLENKNMKKCTDEIKLDDFEITQKDVPLWMPLTLLMK
jgi:hypothetical protein